MVHHLYVPCRAVQALHKALLSQNATHLLIMMTDLSSAWKWRLSMKRA